MLLCLGNVRITRIQFSSLGDLRADHHLVRFDPALHQVQHAHGHFWNHPVVHAGIGLFRRRAQPVKHGALIVLCFVVRA
ncbi:hypothetical protein D3C80_1306500 [compost metagenome]